MKTNTNGLIVLDESDHVVPIRAQLPVSLANQLNDFWTKNQPSQKQINELRAWLAMYNDLLYMHEVLEETNTALSWCATLYRWGMCSDQDVLATIFFGKDLRTNKVA